MPIQSKDIRSTAKSEFDRRLKKLEKRGAVVVAKDVEGVKDGTLMPKLKARAPKASTVKTVLFSRQGVATVQSAAAGSNYGKGPIGGAKLAEDCRALDSHHVTDGFSAATSAVGATTYGIAAGINIAKLDSAIKSEQANMASAAEIAESARLYHETDGREGNVNHYLKFCKVTEPIFGKRGHASSASIDQKIFGLNIGRYLASFGSAISSMAGSIAKFGTASTTVATTAATATSTAATTITAGVLSMVSGGFETGVSGFQYKKVRRELKANKSVREGLAKWEENQKAENSGSLDTALNLVANQENQRRRDYHQTTRKNARVGLGKGIVGIIFGAVSIALFCVLAVATAGLIVGIASGVVIAACLTYAVPVIRREIKANREVKRQQRQARALMNTHSIEELKRMMQSKDVDGGKCEVVTLERIGTFSRKKMARIHSVDVRDNAYLGLEIRAHDFAANLGKLNWEDPETRQAIEATCKDFPKELDSEEAALLSEEQIEGRKKAIESERLAIEKEKSKAKLFLGVDTVKSMTRLKAMGMSAFNLKAVCHQAMLKPKGAEDAHDPQGVERSSAFLRQHMATAEKFAWTPESKPLHTKVYLLPLMELLKQYEKDPATGDYTRDQYKEIACRFRAALGERTYQKFDRSLQGLAAEENESEMLRIARVLPHYADLSQRDSEEMGKPAVEPTKLLWSLGELLKKYHKDPGANDYSHDQYKEIASEFRTALGSQAFKQFDYFFQSVRQEEEQDPEVLRVAYQLAQYAGLSEKDKEIGRPVGLLARLRAITKKFQTDPATDDYSPEQYKKIASEFRKIVGTSNLRELERWLQGPAQVLNEPEILIARRVVLYAAGKPGVTNANPPTAPRHSETSKSSLSAVSLDSQFDIRSSATQSEIIRLDENSKSGRRALPTTSSERRGKPAPPSTTRSQVPPKASTSVFPSFEQQASFSVKPSQPWRVDDSDKGNSKTATTRSTSDSVNSSPPTRSIASTISSPSLARHDTQSEMVGLDAKSQTVRTPSSRGSIKPSPSSMSIVALSELEDEVPASQNANVKPGPAMPGADSTSAPTRGRAETRRPPSPRGTGS